MSDWSSPDPDVCEVLNDRIDRQRPDGTDDHGRDSSLTTQYGRLSGTTVRETVYKATRPCYYGDDSPHNRDSEECEGTYYGSYSRCLSSVSPHTVRRGSITHHRSGDVPETVVEGPPGVDVVRLVYHTQGAPSNV